MEWRGMIHRVEECGIDAKRRRERRRPKECRRRGLLPVFKYYRTYRVPLSLKVFLDQYWCVYPICTFPTIVRGTVALPSDKKLQFFCLSMAPRVEHLFNFIFFFSFDKFRRWFMEISSMFCRFSIWHKQGRVEDIVKGPMRGELEAVDDRRDLLEHFEGTISFWCQLHGWVTQS